MRKPITIIPDGVLTAQGLLEQTAVVVDDTRIVELSDASRHHDVAVGDVVRLPGRILLPGLVNAHSHAFQRAIRGRTHWRAAGRSDFWSWRSSMYAVANGLSPEGIEAVSRLAFLEMALSGVTAVGEFHYLHRQADGTPYDDPDELAHRVIAAARDVGLRICLLRVAYGRGGINVTLGPEQQRFRTDDPGEALAAAHRIASTGDPLVSAGIAPHSIRAVPTPWLPELASWTGVVHAHVSEQPAENQAALEATGRSPLALFADAGLVTDRFSAVHLTHPLSGDLDIMSDAGAHIVACPTTELDLGDGFLAVDALPLPVCVGSDSQATIDLLAEARALELHARALTGRRNVMGASDDRHSVARRVIDAASGQGARALGLADGGIAPGMPADLIAISLDRPEAAGVPPLEAIAFSAGPSWVSDVWVAGERIVKAGAHAKRDAIVRAALPYL